MRRDLFYCLLIVVLVLGVFIQVRAFDFIHFDDGRMVYENPQVLTGFSWANIKAAFSKPLVGIWMPVTILTYLVDAECYGEWVGGYHLTSVALHALGAVLLYLALRKMTGHAGRSAFVALAFALHPLRLNSVVWIASRKDVVCGLFWFLAMLAYAHYAVKPGWRRFALVVLAMALGLMSKTLIVTLPCALLLLDWWPLERFAKPGAPAREKMRRAARLVLEKAPLFALSAAGAAIAVFTQVETAAVMKLDDLPLTLRVENAAAAYARYLLHLFWPIRLSIFYPYPADGLALGRVIGAVVVLLLITAMVLWLRRRRYLATGWFWFLGILVPMIGVVQLGSAAMADRYTYIPGIGILVMLSWGVADGVAWACRSAPRRGLWLERGLAGIVLVALGSMTWWQIGYWRNTDTIFERALAVTVDNDLAHTKLGEAALDRGDTEEALMHFREALRIRPNHPDWNYNLGCALIEAQQYAEACTLLEAAVQLQPDHAGARTNLGIVLLHVGRTKEALVHLEEAVRLAPAHVNARINYGVGLLRDRRPEEAVRQLTEALALDPANEAARLNLELARKAGTCFPQDRGID